MFSAGMSSNESNHSLAPDDPKQRIVTAARHRFLQHGFRSVTMDEIAVELGMSKKTLYAYFQSKTDLLRDVLSQKLDEVERELSQATSHAEADFFGTLSAVVACMHRHTEEVQPAFVRDVQRSAPEIFAMVETRRHHIIEKHFGKLLAEGRRSGLVRRDIPAKLMIAILLSAVQGVMNPQRLRELGATPRTGVSAILDLFLQGAIVRTPL